MYTQREIIIFFFRLVIPTIPANASWEKNGVTVTGGHRRRSAANKLHNPFGLCLDDDTTLIVADTSNHRIIQWKLNDTNGQVVAGGKGAGNLLHQLNYPSDFLIDKETNSLIICDQGNQ